MRKNFRTLLMAFLLGGVALNAAAQDVEVFPQLGHTAGVFSVAFSPDEKQIVSGDYDGYIKLWDAESGREIRTLLGHTDKVTSLSFSPDGTQILSGSDDGTIKLWELNTGREIRTFFGHTDEVSSVAFSPDGKQVLSGSFDNTVKLWDKETGNEIRIFSGHEQNVSSVCFSPEGKQILSGSYDGTIRLWDIDTGQELQIFSVQKKEVDANYFDLDRKQALLLEDNSFVLWDLGTGRQPQTFSGYLSYSFDLVKFSVEGKYVLLFLTNDDIILWDLETRQELQSFSWHESENNSGYLSPDGNQVLLLLEDDVITLWDIEASQELVAFSPKSYPADLIYLSSDGKYVLFASWWFNDDIIMWDMDTGHRTFVYFHKEDITVAFSPDAKQILSGSWDGTITLWDIDTGHKSKTFLGHANSIHSVAFSPDGKRVLSGSDDDTVKIWDIDTGQELRSYYGWVNSNVVFSPSGSQILVCLSGNIKLLDTETGREARAFSSNAASVRSAVFSPNGKQILSSSYANTIKFWDIELGLEIRTFSGHTGIVPSIAFSPDGKQFLSGSWDGTVKLWDIETGLEGRTFPGYNKYFSTVEFSPDGSQIIFGSEDMTVSLWDISTGQEVRTFSGHTHIIRYVAFSLDGNYVISGSGDNTIRFWETESGLEIKTFLEENVSSVALSPDRKQILFATYDGTIILRDIETGLEIRTFHTNAVHSVAFSPDGKKFLSGSSDKTVKLWDVNLNNEIMSFSGHTDIVFTVAFSPDGNQVLSGSFDGTVRLWDVSAGKEIAQFIGFTDGEWIVITPDGYYNASLYGDKYLNVRVGNKVYGIDEFRKTFNNPQIVEARLQGRPDPVLVAETIQNAASFEPPRVVISNPVDRADLASGQVELSVTVVDQNQPISNIEVVVNGSRVGMDDMRGVNTGERGFSRASPTLNVTGTDRRVSFQFPVNLKAGNNIIEVIASNGKADGKDRIEVNCLSASERLPDLWILSIGVNSYNDNGNLKSLNYAVNDAQAIIDVFKNQEGKQYGQVNSLLVADGTQRPPTRDNIIDSFDYFRQAGEQDVLLLFIAGHGMNDDRGNFYFLPSDAAFNDDGSIRISRAISHRDLQSVLDGPGQKLLFIDACHSAGTGSRLTQSTNNTQLARQLDNNSTVIFTSSKGTETSKEMEELGHGAFTYAILEGLRGEADPYKDGSVTMKSLDTYVSRKVPQLTDRTQTPATYTPEGYVDFQLADLR